MGRSTALLFLLVFLRSSSCTGLRITLEGSAAIDHENVSVSTYPGFKCGYGKDDVLNSARRAIAYTDPRAQFKDFGYARGFASQFMRISRSMLNTRAIGLELTAQQAEKLIYAQYGIIYSRVPPSCFAELRAAVGNAGRTWQEIRSRRAELRVILNERLPVGCSSNASKLKLESLDKTLNASELQRLTEIRKQGKTASTLLQVLQFGYWTGYEPLIDEAKSVIAVRALDELRFNSGTGDRLRQIWHFGKHHMLLYTEVEVRQAIRDASAASEKARLQSQMWEVISLEGLRDARLEFLEIDGLQNCVSAQPHDVDHLIDAIRTHAPFRVTLMWRERAWQAFFKAPLRFLQNPLSSTNKFMERTADEWHRTGVGHRIVMLLKPIVVSASLAGIAIGVLSGGQAGLATVMANVILTEGYKWAYAVSVNQGLINFLLYKLLRWPLERLAAPVIDSASVAYFNNKYLQRLWHAIDDSKVLGDANFNLNQEVDRIMHSHTVVQMLQEQASGHGEGDDDFGVREEVRRYVAGLVMGGFSDEVVPAIQDLIDRRVALQDPNYGWLCWNEWEKFRTSARGVASSTLLKGLRVRGKGISGVSYVNDITRSFWTRESNMKLVEESEHAGDWMSTDVFLMKLDRSLKDNIYIEDFVAYKRSKVSWLLWDDWADYRHGSSGYALKGKHIYLDLSLQGCSDMKVQEAEPCLYALPTHADTSDSAAVVTKTSFKILGYRYIYTDKACTSHGFALTPAVKACLRVQDPDAYARFENDVPRRTAEEAWLAGESPSILKQYASPLDYPHIGPGAPIPGLQVDDEDEGAESTGLNSNVQATDKAAQQIKKEMICSALEGGSVDSLAEAGNQVLESQFGLSSTAFEMADSLALGSEEEHEAVASRIPGGEGEVSEMLRQAKEGFQEESRKIECA